MHPGERQQHPGDPAPVPIERQPDDGEDAEVAGRNRHAGVRRHSPAFSRGQRKRGMLRRADFQAHAGMPGEPETGSSSCCGRVYFRRFWTTNRRYCANANGQ